VTHRTGTPETRIFQKMLYHLLLGVNEQIVEVLANSLFKCTEYQIFSVIEWL